MEMRLLEQDLEGSKAIKLIGFSYWLLILAYLLNFLFNPTEEISNPEPISLIVKIFFILQDAFYISIPLVCFLSVKKVCLFKIIMLIFTIVAIGNLYDDVFSKSFTKDVTEIGIFILSIIWAIRNYGKI